MITGVNKIKYPNAIAAFAVRYVNSKSPEFCKNYSPAVHNIYVNLLAYLIKTVATQFIKRYNLNFSYC